MPLLQGPCIFRDCRQSASCSGNRFYSEDGVLHVIWVRATIACGRPVHCTIPTNVAVSSKGLKMGLMTMCGI